MADRKDIALRDMREQFAWQSQDALRILFEEHKGVESRNLITLYTALTLKAAQRFDSVFLTQNEDIIEYTGLHKDWVPEGLRILERERLIDMEFVRDNQGKYLGKLITLLPAPKRMTEETTFLGPSLRKENDAPKVSVVKRKADMIDRDTWDSLKDILEYAVDIGAFGTRMPQDTGGGEPVMATKEVQTIIRYIIEISKGEFAHNHGLDIEYDPSNFRYVIMKALDEFVKMKEDPAIWPNDKSVLPTAFSVWFVNPRSGFSWFGRCVKGATSNAEHYQGAGAADVENATPDVTPERLAQMTKWWTERNYVIGDRQKIQLRYNIQRIIDVHKRIWEEYGQYYAKTGSWLAHFGGTKPDLFLRKFYEYLSTYGGDPHHAKVSPDSMSFDNFLAWIRNEYKFDLNLSESARQKLIERAKPKPKVETPESERQSAADLMNDPFMRRILMGSLADDPEFKDIGRR